MTDVPDAPARARHRWPAWALPTSLVAGLGAAGVGAGLAVARYGDAPGRLAFGLAVLLLTVLCGAAVVSRAMRHERRRYAVTEVSVILAVALLLYAGSQVGRMALTGLVGGGLLAIAWTIRRDAAVRSQS